MFVFSLFRSAVLRHPHLVKLARAAAAALPPLLRALKLSRHRFTRR